MTKGRDGRKTKIKLTKMDEIKEKADGKQPQEWRRGLFAVAPIGGEERVRSALHRGGPMNAH